MTKQELMQSFNMNEREFNEYNQTIVRVLTENFLKDVFGGKMTMSDAIKESVILWDKKQKDMTMQLLTGRVGDNSYGVPKMAAFADASLDFVYNALQN